MTMYATFLQQQQQRYNCNIKLNFECCIRRETRSPCIYFLYRVWRTENILKGIIHDAKKNL